MITPNQLAKSGTEHAHQTALFAWCAVACQIGIGLANRWNDGDLLQADFKAEMNMAFGRGIPVVPELKWFHAIPNGGTRGDDAQSRAIRGGQLKAEGVKAGVSDTLLPVKRGPFSGLYIEMKKPGGKPSPEQLEFGRFVKSQGFAFVVCDHWEIARYVIVMYLDGYFSTYRDEGITIFG